MKMIGQIEILYDPEEQETADLIRAACDRSLQLSQEIWGLGPPPDCRIYVMTSWLGFFFRSAPLPWRIMLGLSLPLWSPRARRTWSFSAAWTQRYGSQVAIGVKPPRLIRRSQKSIGISLFVEEIDSQEKIQHVTCHELVHACSAHLSLPAWVNEGIAMLTVDRFLGKQTIRTDTFIMVRDFLPKTAPPSYKSLSRMGLQEIAYHTARAYWLVRYLEDVRPGFLRQQFGLRKNVKGIEQELIAALGMEPGSFWFQVDSIIASHFEEKGVSISESGSGVTFPGQEGVA